MQVCIRSGRRIGRRILHLQLSIDICIEFEFFHRYDKHVKSVKQPMVYVQFPICIGFTQKQQPRTFYSEGSHGDEDDDKRVQYFIELIEEVIISNGFRTKKVNKIPYCRNNAGTHMADYSSVRGSYVLIGRYLVTKKQIHFLYTLSGSKS